LALSQVSLGTFLVKYRNGPEVFLEKRR